MKVSELGEFGLIELFKKILGSPGDEVLIGIGDDAAAWRTDGPIQIATTDALIENVHFILSNTSWRELGWKALAVNLSDIAAMGGLPKYAIVSLGLPGDTEVESLSEFYKGMAELARLFNVAIIGGDVVAAPLVMLSPAVMGTADNVLTRSAAVARDQIAVTGLLGASAAGLAMLQKDLKFDDETASSLREFHVKPYPRSLEGQILARNEVKAAIDISDGLVGDLAKLCKASSVGARLFTDEIPIHPLVRTAFKDDSLSLALSGGEDYELLFTGSMEVVAKVKGLMPCPVTVIGEITGNEPGRVRLFDEHGNEAKIEREGWEHFAPRNAGKYR